MAFLIIIAVIIFFSWRFIVAVVGGAIEFSIFVIRHIQVILPLLLFSWVWVPAWLAHSSAVYAAFRYCQLSCHY